MINGTEWDFHVLGHLEPGGINFTLCALVPTGVGKAIEFCFSTKSLKTINYIEKFLE